MNGSRPQGSKPEIREPPKRRHLAAIAGAPATRPFQRAVARSLKNAGFQGRRVYASLGRCGPTPTTLTLKLNLKLKRKRRSRPPCPPLSRLKGFGHQPKISSQSGDKGSGVIP